MELQGNKVWLATPGGVVARNFRSGTTECFNRSNSALPADLITDLAIDDQGHVWAAHREPGDPAPQEGGLSVFRKGQWEVVSGPETLPARSIRSLTFDNGYLIAGFYDQNIGIKDSSGNWRLLKTGELPVDLHDVTDAVVDDQGYLWCLSEYDGLYRYRLDGSPADAASWKTWTDENDVLPDSQVKAIERGKEGVWILSESGIFPVREGKPTPGKSALEFPFTEQHTDCFLSAMDIASDGSLWVVGGTEEKQDLFRRAGEGNWEKITGLGERVAVSELLVRNDSCFLGGRNGLEMRAGKQRTLLDENLGLMEGPVRDMLYDQEGALWVTGPAGPVRLGEKQEQGAGPVHERYPWEAVALAGGVDGILYAGSFEGVFQKNGEWGRLTPDDETMVLEGVGALAFHEGDLWVGMEKRGVVRMDEEGRWERIGGVNRHLSKAQVNAIEGSPAGDLWIAARDGMYRFDGEQWEEVRGKMNDQVSLHRVKSIAFDDAGGMWLGGVASYDPKTQQAVEYGLVERTPEGEWKHHRIDSSSLTQEPYHVTALLVDEQGNKWMGLAGGEQGMRPALARFDRREEWQWYTPENSQLPASLITDLLLRNDTLLIGTHSSGLWGLEFARPGQEAEN